MLRGDIIMNFNQEEMKGEADKAINIHAMMMGRQIMLCKKKKITKESPFVFLWPSRGLYIADWKLFEMMYKDDLQHHHSVFLLSDIGRRYQENNSIQVVCNNNQKSKMIAKVDYIKIVPNRKMFIELRNIGEFSLWDIDGGPMRYFTRPNGKIQKSGYIAIYRVYKLPKGSTNIRHTNIKFDKGQVPYLTESSFERISNSIINSNGLEPVEAVRIDNVDDVLRKSFIKGDFFEARKKKIMAIVEEYRP